MASTNITAFPGKVGVSNANPTHTLSIGSNVFVDDTGTNKLVVLGSISTTGTLSGDGSGISNIQSSNVNDFASNVSRITNLEASNVDVWSNLTSNAARVTSLESDNMTISGIKTFEDDIILESNLRVQGDLLVANTINMVVSDPIMELGSNNLNTGDIGFVMTRHGASESNVTVFYDETEDRLKIGYTLNSANDTVLALDSNALPVDIQGELTVGGDVTVTDTTSGSAAGPEFSLYRNQTGTNGDYLGQLRFDGKHDGGNDQLYAKITGKIKKADQGGEDGVIETAIITDGSQRISLRHTGDLFHIKKGTDFQVGETANLYVDTATSRVGIGMSNPSYTLDVDGDINLSTGSTLKINGTDAVFSNWTANGSDIYRSSGNVGIGTASPAAVLDVFSSPHVTGYREMAHFRVSNTSDDSDFTRLIFGQVATNKMFLETTNEANTKGDLLLQPYGGKVGIGATSPIAALDINGGAENNTTPALSIRGGLYDPSDLYVLNTYNVNTGVGFAAKVIGVNIKNKVETDNTVQIRNNIGGVTSAGAIYLGADDVNQGIFGVLGGTGTAGSTLAEYLTVKGNGNVGIGTASPAHKLNVVADSGDAEVHIQAQGNAGDSIIYFNGSHTSQRKCAILSSNVAPASWCKQDLHFCHNTDSNYDDVTIADSKMVITNVGNVGIGTNNPLSQLDIKAVKGITTAATVNDLVSNATIRISGYAENHDALCIGMLGTDTSGNSGNNPYAYIQNIWDTPSTARPLLLNPAGGNVGIGTTNPGYKLNVLTDTNYDGISLRDSTRELVKIAKGNNGAYINMFESSVSKVNISTNGNNWLNGGNVGIGTNAPSYKLHISAGNDSITWYGPNTSWSSYLAVGAASDKTVANNTTIAQCISTNGNLHLDAGHSRDIYMNYYSGNYIRHNGLGVYSDDRLKTDEELITNATDTLLKLSPQKYLKKYTLRENETREPFTETGLIAQDIWYDAPELRHIVMLGADADPTENKPEAPVDGDIQQDPDYSSWGPNTASVNYDGLIAYLVKSNQELHGEIQALKARIAALENA